MIQNLGCKLTNIIKFMPVFFECLYFCIKKKHFNRIENSL